MLRPPYGVREKRNVAVQHALSAKKPAKFLQGLESDLAFSHAHIKKDLEKFFAPPQKISETFALVDNGVLR